MLTFGELQRSPKRVAELQIDDVLIAAVAGGAEVVIREAPRDPEATMVFQHETIAIMRAERAERLDKLRGQLNANSVVVPIRKKEGSFWDSTQVTIGRASTSDIMLEDPAVSNVHAHLERGVEDGSVAIQDLGSSNGTFVNRAPLQPHVATALRSGDCVRFGQTVFYYVSSLMLTELLKK